MAEGGDRLRGFKVEGLMGAVGFHGNLDPER